MKHFDAILGHLLSSRVRNVRGGTVRSRGTWLMVLALVGGLASCGPTSPQPQIAEGQRRCVIYHPYYYNGDKRADEVEIRHTLVVQIGGGEKYTLRPYRSLQVPIPRSGTVIEVLDNPVARFGYEHRSESAKVPAGRETAYVRVARSQLIGLNTYVADRARLVSPEVAKKELAEFE
jgi:hypothetical protein